MKNNFTLDVTLKNYSKNLFENDILNNICEDIKNIKKELEKEHRNKKYIEDFIKHKFLHSISDSKKSNLGKYYTPFKLVKLINNMVKPYVQKHSFILDLACGCGAFLDDFSDNKIIARDIDKIAINILKELGYENAGLDNSLLDVSRAKYNLEEDDHIVIIGNPPYNDKTSKVKKTGVNAKVDELVLMDEDIRTNDLGISFLNCFAKLNANIICILHPLSYLIKESNFNIKMKRFVSNYILKDAIIFSSSEFYDTQKTPFPIGAFLYLQDKNGMNYDYIENFIFKSLYDDENFIISNYETIDGYIRKYPPKKNDMNKKSDIGLYMHNIRDLNSLITSGNLTEKEDLNKHITINYKDLYKYAYLNTMRRYFKKDYKFGNLSPLVCSKDLENDEYLRDIFIIDTIINNQRLNVFNKENKNSIIWTKSLIPIYKEKMKKYNQKDNNIYDIFLNFVYNNINQIEKVKYFLIDYFNKLKEKKRKKIKSY